jgi:hypothetical protein
MIKLLLRIVLFFLLTLVTQVGGLLYLCYKLLGFFLEGKIEKKVVLFFVKIGSFLTIYLFFTLIIIPPLAKKMGRVQLPFYASEKMPICARSCWNGLANRTYVKADLLETINRNALLFQTKYPDAKIVYFESGFPFLDNFPLLPHLSHDDGRKIDLALFYRYKKDNRLANTTPHWFGYGISEEPRANEYDRPAECREKGYRWYSFIRNYVISQKNRKYFTFDEQATADFVRLLAKDENISMILIEPHLKQRLGLDKENKIRLHGCNAVRHDDHIHVNLKK